MSNAYLDGAIASTAILLHQTTGRIDLTIEPARGGFTGLPARREWVIRVHQVAKAPACVTANGRGTHPVYDAARQVLIFECSGESRKRIRCRIR